MGQFEWESSNLKVAYPFQRPGADSFNEAFADALVLDTDQDQLVRIDSLDISDWSPTYISIEVAYADGSPFFSGDPTVTVEAYGAWQLVTASRDGKSVQLIMNGAHSLPIAVTSALYFVTRVQECDPEAITSIEVTDGETEVVHTLTGDLLLQGGYNIVLQESVRTYTERAGAVSLDIEAIAGAGYGVAPSPCDPDGDLRSINAVGPDLHGHFVLGATDCYRAIIPIISSPTPGIFDPTPATVQLFNDCEQCCKCEDYENTYRAIDRLYNKGRNTGLRLARTIDDFKDMKDAIEDERDTRSVPSMNLLLRPAPGYIMGVQVNLLNNRTSSDMFMNQDDIDDVLVKLVVTSPDVSMSGATVLPKTCYLFNSQYGNPWIHTESPNILLDPVSWTSPDGVGLIITAGLVAGKYYHIIKTTEFVSIFFEIYWAESSSPSQGDEISVKLVSSVFKPYTLTKIDELVEPFEGG